MLPGEISERGASMCTQAPSEDKLQLCFNRLELALLGMEHLVDSFSILHGLADFGTASFSNRTVHRTNASQNTDVK